MKNPLVNQANKISLNPTTLEGIRATWSSVKLYSKYKIKDRFLNIQDFRTIAVKSLPSVL